MRNSLETNTVRFEFGKNWQGFLSAIDDERIEQAEDSLRELLKCQDLAGLSFLDVGSGSGLFSLAARKLGASVHSIDCDEESIACTAALRDGYCPDDKDWSVERQSVLSPEFTSDAGNYDVVYSWGVLHHTGDMWTAIERTLSKVRKGGRCAISIYNDQGWLTRYWRTVKSLYNRNGALRLLMIVLHGPYLIGARFIVRAMTGRKRLERGMNYWHDMIDWLGGLPFEVARPDEIVLYVQARGFRLSNLKTCGGRSGCNEFVFERER